MDMSSIFTKEAFLKDLISYQDDSIVSKTLLNKDKATLTIFAFAKGQSLSEHTVGFDAFVYVVDGNADIYIDNKLHRMCTGQIMVMPANVPHRVNAAENFKMLLFMVKP